MFLSVITRTYKRPIALSACIGSLLAQATTLRSWQAGRDWEHLLLVDEVGVGIGETYRQMRERDWSDLKGDWVYILDDDNLLLDGAMESLRGASQGADLIIARADLGERGTIPDDDHWGTRPRLGRIDMGCVCFRRDLFTAAVRYTLPRYEGDYYMITGAYELAEHVAWLDKTIMHVQRISMGRPE